jgi:acyl-CoA hydrolase
MTPISKQQTAPGDSPVQSRLIDLVFPGDTNHHGTLFGGAGFALMDRIAFISATRHGRVPFVTASCNRIDFRAPARIGRLVELVARPMRAGRRSLIVEVEMVAEDLIGGERHLCTRGSFAMVAMPDSENPDWRLPAIPAEVLESAGGELRMTDIVFADQANSFGKMFGGDALAAMTKAAFVVASRRSRMVTVLASSRRIDFKHPIPVGSIIDVVAEIVQAGRTSVTVAVELWSERLLDGSRQLTARGEFVMVSVGPDGRPTAHARRS